MAFKKKKDEAYKLVNCVVANLYNHWLFKNTKQNQNFCVTTKSTGSTIFTSFHLIVAR